MTDIVIRNLQSLREKTRKIAEQLIEAEQNYLYTTDVDYLTNQGAFFPVRIRKIYILKFLKSVFRHTKLIWLIIHYKINFQE